MSLGSCYEEMGEVMDTREEWNISVAQVYNQ